MTYLLGISIGPVQDFIAAARRTADLYAGSRMLQDIVDAAARTLPTPSGAEWGIGRVFPVDTGAGGANKLLAVVDNPQQAAATAETAARQALRQAWVRATGLMGAALDHVDQPRANRQIDDFLEFYAAWVPVTEVGYGRARVEVEKLLAGTKALRAFRQQPGDDAQIANSGLDPLRPNVIARAKASAVPATLVDQPPLRLKSTELLDAVSLVKRALSANRRILSTRELAQRSIEPGFVSRRVDGDDEPDVDMKVPYFAVLVADGDRMGEQLERHDSPAAHRLLARKLDEFSRQASVEVESADGQLVYAGGDDVLAFLPVTSAVECAERLAASFARFVPGASLSVGVAIVHYKEPLSLGLQRGRDAERTAKIRRNSLAVAVHKRAGNPVVHSETWTERTRVDGSKHLMARRLSVWLDHHRARRVSHSLAFSLRQLVLGFPPDPALGAVLDGEVRRVIEHTENDPAVLGDVPVITSVDDLRGFVNALIVSRVLAGVGDA